MSGEPVNTVVGNLVADPEIRFTPSGAAVASFRIASTPRTFNRQTSQWEEGQALFLSCSVWRDTADNVASSLKKGMRVIVQGRLTQRSYQTRDGQDRTVFELQVDEVGPSLRYAKAEVTRVPRGGAPLGGAHHATQGGQGTHGDGRQGGYQPSPSLNGNGLTGDAETDPWAVSNPFGNEPPF